MELEIIERCEKKERWDGEAVSFNHGHGHTWCGMQLEVASYLVN